jgi:hypothetical protein
LWADHHSNDWINRDIGNFYLLSQQAGDGADGQNKAG